MVMRLISGVVLCLAFCTGAVFARTAVAAPFWIVHKAELFRIDIADRSVIDVGPLGISNEFVFGGLAYDAESDRLLGLLGDGLSNISTLYDIDRTTGQATVMARVSAATKEEWFSGFDISPQGDVVGRTQRRPLALSTTIYTIDLMTGAASPQAKAPQITPGTDMAFGADGSLFDLGRESDELTLFSINPTTGEETNIGSTFVSTRGAVDMSLGFNPDDGNLYWINDELLYRTSPLHGATDILSGFSQWPFQHNDLVGTFAPVPEPSTFSLLLLGGLLCRYRRRP